MTAPTIWAKVMADTVQFQEGMAQVKKSLKQVGEQVRAAGEQIRSVAVDFTKWGAAAVAAAAAAGAAIIKNSLDSIKELRNLSNAAGLTVAELQRGAYAAQQFGIEQDKFADILKDVNDKVGDFLQVGSGPMVDFFENIAPKVGVTADMFKDLNSQQALGLYVQSLERANLSQAEMTFYMEAIASDSTLLLPLLKDNAKAFRQLDEEARKLNIGLSGQQVAQAMEAQKRISSIWSDLKNQVTIFVADISPLITAFLTQVSEQLRKFAGNGEDSFNRAMASVSAFGESLAFLSDVMRGISVFFEAVKTGALVLYATLTNLASGVMKFGVAIQEKLTAPIQGAADAFHGLRVLLAAGFFDPFFDQLKLLKANLTDALVEPLKLFLEMAAKLPESVGGDMFKEALEGVRKFENEAKGVIDGIAQKDGITVGLRLGIDTEAAQSELNKVLNNVREVAITGDTEQLENAANEAVERVNAIFGGIDKDVAASIGFDVDPKLQEVIGKLSDISGKHTTEIFADTAMAQAALQDIYSQLNQKATIDLGINGDEVTAEAKAIFDNIGQAVITGDFSQVKQGLLEVKQLAGKTIDDISKQNAVIGATVELDTSGVGQDVENMLRSVGTVADQYVAEMNSLSESFAGHATEMTGIAVQSAEELHASMMQAMPSEQVNSFFDNWIAKAKEARAAMSGKDESTANTENGVDEFGQSSGEVPEAPALTALQAYQAETVGLLEAMGLRYQMQEEYQLAQYERELALLNEQLRKKEIASKEHADKVAEIERQKAETQREMLVTNLEEGFAALSNNSKKVEKMMRAVAIAQALIKGQQAAVDAWQAGMSTGGPTAPLVAAAYTAASLARTGAMISSLRGGGSSAGGGGSAAVPAINQGGYSGGSSSQQAQPVSQRIFNVEFRGESGMGTQQTRKLLELINEQAGDNVAINLRG